VIVCFLNGICSSTHDKHLIVMCYSSCQKKVLRYGCIAMLNVSDTIPINKESKNTETYLPFCPAPIIFLLQQ
jgi:hypothetical protein